MDNNLLRCFSKAMAVGGLLAIFCVFDVKSFASDYERMDVSLMNFIDSTSFNLKGFDIKIKEITTSEMFDDNIIYTKKDTQEDFIAKLGLGISAQYEGKKSTLEVIGNVNHEAFAEYSNLDYTAQDLTLNFKSEFSQYDRISLKNVFTNTVAPLFFEGPSFSANQQVGNLERSGYYQNRFTIDYVRDVLRQLTVKVKYANDVDAFETETLLNSFVNRVGFETNYLLGPMTTLLFTYDLSNRQFEDEQNASINTIAQGVRQYITEKLYFDIGCGLDFVDSYKEDTFIEPIVLSAFTYDMNKNTQLRLSFNKKDDTGPFDKQIAHYWRTSLFFTRQVSERIGCAFGLSYSDTEYTPSNFEQKVLQSDSAFTYDINKHLKGSLSYTYSQSETTHGTADYTKNIVSLGLMAEF